VSGTLGKAPESGSVFRGSAGVALRDLITLTAIKVSQTKKGKENSHEHNNFI
jgi:hypothetical protein